MGPTPEFRPYIGSRTIEHFGNEVGQPHSMMTYGSDQSGTVEYRFNRLGFRGDELDPSAARSIYVCGCSHTFGTGNAEEHTWPTPFADLYAGYHGIEPGNVSVVNFSEGGTSNRYIARTLIDQCRVHKPDLAIAHFSEVGRTEFLFPPGLWRGEIPFGISKSFAGVGPWQSANWLKRQYWLLRDFRGVERRPASEILRWGRAYYTRTYRSGRAAYETLQDILMFQFFCQAADIDFLICCVDYGKLVDALDNSAVRALWEMVDHDRLTDFAVSDAGFRVDRAADGSHPGQESHRRFAEKLFEHYHGHQSSSNASL